MQYRIHLTGAACSGVTTLGKAIATKLDLPFVDADDHYWAPVDPPYSLKREPTARLASLQSALGNANWVLSGSCGAWGSPITETANLIVFIYTPSPIRMERLKKRESARFGARIEEGGDMYKIHKSFVEWANSYDDPCFGGRSLAGHEYWMSQQKAPILRLDGTLPVSRLLREVLGQLQLLVQAA